MKDTHGMGKEVNGKADHTEDNGRVDRMVVVRMEDNGMEVSGTEARMADIGMEDNGTEVNTEVSGKVDTVQNKVK